MRDFQVVSLDMFQTLVDVNKRIPQIWQGILGRGYSEELAGIGAAAIYHSFPSAYGHSTDSVFMTMEEIYKLCAEDVVKQTGFAVDPCDVAYHLMLQHGYAPFYEDVPQVLEKIKSQHKLIISSDANHLMIDPILDMLDFDKAFISDDIGYYKGDTGGNFFKNVVSELKISPDKIIHIGDSYADISGAHNAGITTCWVNREHKKWSYSIQPDYIIGSFDELIKILE